MHKSGGHSVEEVNCTCKRCIFMGLFTAIDHLLRKHEGGHTTVPNYVDNDLMVHYDRLQNTSLEGKTVT